MSTLGKKSRGVRAGARVWAGLSALVALAACGDDAPTLADTARARDAATRDADFENVDLTDPDNWPAQDTSVDSVCDFAGAIGVGVMTGALEGKEPVLRPSIPLDRFPDGLPSIFQARTVEAPFWLRRHAEGSFAISSQGFFDIGKEGARFHRMPTIGPPTMLSGDLDGDGDEDAIAIGLAAAGAPADDDAGASTFDPFAIFLRRNGAGVLEQVARDSEAFDSRTPLAVLTDYDVDGDDDLVFAQADGTLYVLRNEGDFVFERALVAIDAYPPGQVLAEALFAEDRNGDGAEDLIAVVDLGTRRDVRVFLNDGTGAFGSPTASSIARSLFENVHFVDVTGDGLSDIAFHIGETYVSFSLDPLRFDDVVAIGSIGQIATFADVDGDEVADVAQLGANELRVYLASERLEGEPLSFDVAAFGVQAMVIRPPRGAEPAQLEALYHAGCRVPCSDACELGCIFEACIECAAHADCDDDEACVRGACSER